MYVTEMSYPRVAWFCQDGMGRTIKMCMSYGIGVTTKDCGVVEGMTCAGTGKIGDRFAVAIH